MRQYRGQARGAFARAGHPATGTSHSACSVSFGVARASPEQHVAQHHGVVVNFIVRRIDKRDRTFARELSKAREELGVAMDLLRVAATELAPSLGIMTEPLAKLGAGCELLQPFVDAGMVFRDPARP